MTDELESLVVLGVIAGSHGVSGRLRVKPFTQTPEAVADYGQVRIGDGSHKIKITGASRGQVIVALDGVRDRDAADALLGLEITVPRAALDARGAGSDGTGDDTGDGTGNDAGEDGQGWFQADLVGLGVETAAGEKLGSVAGVFDFGAGDLLEIMPTAGGQTVMMAFTHANVPEVDIEGGRLVVDPPLGTFEVETDKPAPRKRRRSPKARERALAEKASETRVAEEPPQGSQDKDDV